MDALNKAPPAGHAPDGYREHLNPPATFTMCHDSYKGCPQNSGGNSYIILKQVTQYEMIPPVCELVNVQGYDFIYQ